MFTERTLRFTGAHTTLLTAFEEHRASPQTARFREEHQPYVTGPPRIEFLEIACAAGGLAPRVPGQKEEAPR